MNENKVIIDHNEIRYWAESRGGSPQIIEEGSVVSVRIDFPGKSDEAYNISNQSHNVEWEKFFEIFDGQNLALQIDIDEDLVRHNPNLQADFGSQYKFIKRNLA